VPMPAGFISDPIGPDNSIGYAGYMFSLEVQLYCQRFRWYSPVLGRWLQRDPAGPVDGSNLYEHVRSRVTVLRDQYGLKACSSDNMGDVDVQTIVLVGNPHLDNPTVEEVIATTFDKVKDDMRTASATIAVVGLLSDGVKIAGAAVRQGGAAFGTAAEWVVTNGLDLSKHLSPEELAISVMDQKRRDFTHGLWGVTSISECQCTCFIGVALSCGWKEVFKSKPTKCKNNKIGNPFPNEYPLSNITPATIGDCATQSQNATVVPPSVPFKHRK
jgi:RHS repeat-associated protein